MAFLRPDADTAAGGWLTAGDFGTNLFAEVDETSANDSDYLKSDPSLATDTLKLRLSDPGGSVDTGQPVTLRYRYGKTGIDPIDLTVRLIEGASTEIASWSHTGVSTTLATATQVLTAPQKAAVTDWNDLSLEFVAATAEQVSFGALTLAGAGGVAKPAAATSADFGTTNLVLTSGFAVPDTGGTVTSGTVTWDDGTIWNVTAVADRYDFTSTAEFTSIMAVGAATLAGKTAHAKGAITGQLSLSSFAPASEFTVTGDPSATLQSISFSSIQNTTFKDLNINVPGWPKTYDAAFVVAGSNVAVKLDGNTARHGYGSSLQSWADDLLTDIPDEGKRLVQESGGTTITTTATRFGPLTWRDATVGIGLIVGRALTGTIHYAVGDNTVTATTGSPTLGASAGIISSGGGNGIDPDSQDWYVSLVTASGTGTAEIRTEQNLGNWQANFIGGSGTFNGLQIRNNDIGDFSNAMLAAAVQVTAGAFVSADNHYHGIHHDIIKVEMNDNVDIISVNDLFMEPTGRGGLLRDTGDATDLHPDMIQVQNSSGSTTPGDVAVINPSQYPSGRPYGSEDSWAHGVYIAAADLDRAYVIGCCLSASSGGDYSLTVAIPTNFAYFLGNTAIGPTPSAVAGAVSINYAAFPSDVLVKNTLAARERVLTPPSTGVFEECYFYRDQGLSAFTDIFANYANLDRTANSHAAVLSALTPSGAAAGIGAENRANYIKAYTTITDLDDVLDWDNLPPIIEWADDTDVTASATYTWPTRTVMAAPTGATVTPGASTEVQINGGTWTSSPTTCSRLDTIAMRRTSGAASATVTASVTINGFVYSADITSAATAPTFTTDDNSGAGTATHFIDTGTIGASVQALRFIWRMNQPSLTNFSHMCQIGAGEGVELEVLTGAGGAYRLSVRDSGATYNLSNHLIKDSGASNVVPGTGSMETIQLDVDFSADTAQLTVGGTAHPSIAFTSASSGAVLNQTLGMLADHAGGVPLTTGTEVEYLEVYTDTGSGLTLHKRIAGNAATVNADAWKAGEDAV